MLRTITAAALLTLAATAVQAQPLHPLDYASTTVSYGDLNLSSPTDAKLLADRLAVAAKEVCTATSGDLTKADFNNCMDAAIAVATSDIESKIDSSMGKEVHANLATMRQQISLE